MIWKHQRPVSILLATGSLLALLYSGTARNTAQIGAILAAVGLGSSVLLAFAWGLLAALVRGWGAHRARVTTSDATQRQWHRSAVWGALMVSCPAVVAPPSGARYDAPYGSAGTVS